MPTPEQLYTEITSGPLKDELATPWSNGDDTSVAAILNRADMPGYIPAAPLQKYLTETGLIAVFDVIYNHLLLPSAMNAAPTAPTPFGLYAMASQILTTLRNNYRAAIGQISTGCDALISFGLITAEQKTAILALEVKISQAQTVWGYDARITPDDVSKARKVGG
jgi:hypothetical protein